MHFSYLIKTIESGNRTIFARQSVNGRANVANKVYISLKGAIVLPWDRQVLGEWNHLFFFTYEIRNVPFNIQFYITIIPLGFA
jgi:hypothetical protein